jgi:hypothetical protein
MVICHGSEDDLAIGVNAEGTGRLRNYARADPRPDALKRIILPEQMGQT